MSKRMKLLGFIAMMAILVFTAALVYSGTVVLPKTGQTTCYNSLGTAVSCAGTGQDGEKLIGEAWPSPRFDNTNVTTGCTGTTPCVKDNLTGLTWVRAGNTPAIAGGGANCSVAGAKNWTNALAYVTCMNAASAYGYSDWRLPNINEIRSLLPNEYVGSGAAWLNANGFTSIADSGTVWYWASTTYISTMEKAWAVNIRAQQIGEGNIAATTRTKSANTFWVLPVRGGS